MKRKIAAVIIVICVLAAAFIIIRKLINNPVSSSVAAEAVTEENAFGSPIAYVEYVNTYLSLDTNGIVCENNSEKPSGIPKIAGIEFTKLIFGKKAEAANNSSIEYVLEVAIGLEKNGIKADIINFNNGTVSIIIDKLTIKFGRRDKTNDKINDLTDFIDKVSGKSGTLNMQNADNNNNGYTFQENH